MDLIHVNLAVADVERSIEFYTTQLGFEETERFEASGTDHRFVEADNGVELQLSEREGAIDHGEGFGHIAVEVDDVDAAVDRIDHHGIIREPGGGHRGARIAFVRDPDGYTIELTEWLDD